MELDTNLPLDVRMLALVLALLSPGALVGISPAQAQNVIHVDQDATGSGDGSSWTDAYPQLQDGLAAAQSGDEVWVAYGTYFPDQGANQAEGDRSSTFRLRDDVNIYGGFAGDEDRRSERNLEADTTTLSGEIGAENFPGDNSYHVVSADGDARTAKLDGFLITKGNANGSDQQANGGGFYINSEDSDADSIQILNVTVRNNEALERGGGLYYNSGRFDNDLLLFTDGTLEINSANGTNARGGGASINSQANASFVRSIFKNNNAQVFGGGLYGGRNLTLLEIRFAGNQSIDGGALYSGGNIIIGDVDFIENSAERSGGALSQTGSAQITDATFRSNSAGNEGGAVASFGNDPTTFKRTDFLNNHVGNTGEGGALSLVGSSPAFINAFFAGNEAGRGGAIFSSGSGASITNSVFSFNTSTGTANNFNGGGGGALYNEGSSDLDVRNVTFANNSAQARGGAVYDTTNSGPAFFNS